MQKGESTPLLPPTTLLIRGSKPNPRRVRTGAPDHQSQGRRGRAHSSLSSSPPARGRPTCRVQEPARAASRGDPTEGELPRPRSLANGTEPHLANPAQALLWTSLRTTLIEWGMGVHLNRPPTTQRGICNPRPDRWGLRKSHPPSREGTARARLKHDEELALITSNGPKLGGSTHGYTSRPLERVPPRSRAHAPSSGVRLARGLTPPRAGSASLEAPSRAHLLPHAGTSIYCSDTAEPRRHAPGNHAPALFRQLPRGSPSPALWGLCDEAGVSFVILCRPLLYG
jgi:hypothetical protein